MKAETLTLKGVAKLLPRRSPDAHKGDFGHLLVVAGSRGMTGAAGLCAWAALRSGAGLVTAACPASERALVAALRPEYMTAGLTETAEGTLHPRSVAELKELAAARRVGALALGPGLSTHPRTVEAVLDIVEGVHLPAVMDADALNALASVDLKTLKAAFKRRRSPSILTPHPGELARLLRIPAAKVQKNRLASAAELARDTGAVVVLKGRGTVVTDGRSAFISPTGNPGLAKGGSGDVLTGVLAGLWVQRPDQGWALPAACLGVFLHGLAADLAVERAAEHCLLASDVIEALPRAFHDVLAR